MTAPRRTKIIATLGPACDEPEHLSALIAAGVNLIRINFSHSSAAYCREKAALIRALAAELQCEVAILGDLQGPKIRITRFQQGKVVLQKGQDFCLDATQDKNNGTDVVVGIDYPALPQDVHPGDTLLLDDGRLVLSVHAIEASRIHCRVVTGGVLSDHKGINRLGGGLSAEALTAKDKADIELVAALDLDYLAVSFPRTAADIDHARALLQQAGGRAGIIAKIERAEAVTAAEDIIQVSDGIMVARGDLGVEIGDAALPGVQKRLIEAARHLNKSVIIATQMMESMIHSSIPTRAEVFDVANAVLDGTDAVMLSAETASGQDPENVVKAMARICLGAEGEKSIRQSQHRIHTQFDQNDEAIAMASMYLANHMGVQAIVCLTESGATPLWMSRIRSGIPILGLSRHTTSLRRMCLFRGVFPIEFDAADLPLGELESATLQHLQQLRWLKPGDQILFTHGDLCGQPGGTNTLKILSVPK